MFQPRQNLTILYLKSVIHNIKNANTLSRKRSDFPDLCIWMQRHPNPEFPAATPIARKLYTSRDDRNNCNEAVLVSVVQLFKKKKGTESTPILSLIWLKCLDPCPQLCVDDTPKKTQAVSFSPEVGNQTLAMRHELLGMSNRVYGEIGSVVGIGRLQKSKLPCQLIEGGPEIVGDLPDNHPPFIWKRGRATLYTNVIMTNFRIELGYDNTIRMLFEKPLKGVM